MINEEVCNRLDAVLQLELVFIDIVHHQDSDVIERSREHLSIFFKEVVYHEKHMNNTLAKLSVSMMFDHIERILDGT